MDDLYPSRRQPGWALAERLDPVVWGSGAGPLHTEQIEAFERDGFLVLEGALPPEEVAPLLGEARRLAEAGGPAQEALVIEADGGDLRSIFAVHKAPAFARVARSPLLLGAARQLLGGEVYVHQSRINLKPGFQGRPFFWHSDFETWHVEDGLPRMRAVSASVLLSENTPVNGPLMLIPGSHRVYVRCPAGTPRDHYKQSLQEQRYGIPSEAIVTQLAGGGGIVQALGPAGTVALFDCNTMHGSAGNLSPSPRHNLFLVYNSMDNQPCAPFGGQEPRPSILAERSPAASLRGPSGVG